MAPAGPRTAARAAQRAPRLRARGWVGGVVPGSPGVGIGSGIGGEPGVGSGSGVGSGRVRSGCRLGPCLAPPLRQRTRTGASARQPATSTVAVRRRRSHPSAPATGRGRRRSEPFSRRTESTPCRRSTSSSGEVAGGLGSRADLEAHVAALDGAQADVGALRGGAPAAGRSSPWRRGPPRPLAAELHPVGHRPGERQPSPPAGGAACTPTGGGQEGQDSEAASEFTERCGACCPPFPARFAVTPPGSRRRVAGANVE